MSFELKINNKPKISKVHFDIDSQIHDKLNQFELSRDFLNKSNTTVLVGTQGSGKTSLMVNLVTKLYKKCFHHIYIFMPHTSRKSLDRKIIKNKKVVDIKENLFDRYLPEDQVYEELNVETVSDLYNKLKMNSENNERSLVIYDDVQDALKNHQVLLDLKKIIANQRHLMVVNIILLQNYFAMDLKLRELIHNVILFELGKSQTEKIFKECIKIHKDKFSDISDFVYDDPNKKRWMFINIPTKRIFKEWDEILLNKDE